MPKLLISFFAVMFLVSCVSTPIKPSIYKGNLPIYPAVVQAISERKTKIETIDVFNDEVLSEYIYIVDVMVPYRFKVLIKKENEIINAQCVGMQLKDSITGVWTDNNSTLVFDQNKYLNDIADEITSTLEAAHKYNTAKNNTLSDLGFVYMVLKDLSDIAREKWVAENLVGRIYKINQPIYSFEHNKNKRFKKKFVARFDYRENSKLNLIYSIDYYTDSNSYSTAKIGSLLSFQGSLSAVDTNRRISLINISLVEK